MEKNKIYNVRKENQLRCIVGIIMGVLTIILTVLALILNVANYYQDESKEAGMDTLRMFTNSSKLLVVISTFLIISYQIMV